MKNKKLIFKIKTPLKGVMILFEKYIQRGYLQ